MTIPEIEQLEKRLREAMLAGDVDTLDDLASTRLVFVTLDGANVGKEADLAAHRSGTLRLSGLNPVEPPHIELCGEEVALVNVAVDLAGTFAGTPFSGRFRYTRVWCLEGKSARIVAGQVCAIREIPR